MSNSSVHGRLRIAAIVFIVALAAWASTGTASAQGCCPTYAVAVSNTVPLACFPLTVSTAWSNGITGTSAFAAPGNVVVPAPNPPGCWQTPLVGLSINGVAIPLPAVLPPCINNVNIGCGLVNICFIQSATGCLAIVIS